MTDSQIKAAANAAIVRGNASMWWLCHEALRGKSWARRILRAPEEEKK